MACHSARFSGQMKNLAHLLQILGEKPGKVSVPGFLSSGTFNCRITSETSWNRLKATDSIYLIFFSASARRNTRFKLASDFTKCHRLYEKLWRNSCKMDSYRRAMWAVQSMKQSLYSAVCTSCPLLNAENIDPLPQYTEMRDGRRGCN